MQSLRNQIKTKLLSLLPLLPVYVWPCLGLGSVATGGTCGRVHARFDLGAHFVAQGGNSWRWTPRTRKQVADFHGGAMPAQPGPEADGRQGLRRGAAAHELALPTAHSSSSFTWDSQQSPSWRRPQSTPATNCSLTTERPSGATRRCSTTCMAKQCSALRPRPSRS